MLQLQQVRCFVALARTLHFGRAAESLHMTQPPLSRQIRLFEEAVGQRLFDRDPRGVRLTAAGERLLPEAEHLLRCGAQAAEAAQSAFEGRSGRVVLGHVTGVVFGLLPEVVAAVAAQLPGVELELQEMYTGDQHEALRAGRVDIALVRTCGATPDIGSECVLREPFQAAIPAGHVLADKASLAHGDFEGQRLLMFLPGAADGFHALLSEQFTAHGVAPLYVQHMRHCHAMLPLVDAGLGVALLPGSLRAMRYAGVRWRPVVWGESIAAEVHMAWRKRDARDSPVVIEVAQLVRRAAALVAQRQLSAGG